MLRLEEADHQSPRSGKEGRKMKYHPIVVNYRNVLVATCPNILANAV
jgi:hypothetical protein